MGMAAKLSLLKDADGNSVYGFGQTTGAWTPPDLSGSSAAAQLGDYWAMVKRVDEGLGRLMDALRSFDIQDHTILLFVSDHGCHFKTRNSEYKRSCHESSVRVPCAAIAPGFNGKGCREELVNLVDLTPSILEAAGLPLPESMQGCRVMASLRGEADFERTEQFIQISEDKVSRALRTRRWKYAVTAMGLDGNLRPNSDTYTEEFLYDLEADPYEQQNLVSAAQLSAVREHLRLRLTEWIREIEGSEVRILPVKDCAEVGQRRVLPGEELL